MRIRQFAQYPDSALLPIQKNPSKILLDKNKLWRIEVPAIKVAKVRAGTVYKLIGIGLTAGFIPLFVLFGVLAATGTSTLTWNEQPVTGLKALYIGPLMGLFMAAIFTALVGSVTAFGLWLYSFFKPLNIEYQLVDDADSDS
ncbi:hypothetical protein [Thiohalobacter thiocyanaticus]|uniref:hypothetical protein n=1 Tax=Thiohalobacter thiocyanaticus TaxID=585455 RepID=UPI000F63B4D0|nr:hypothetical protein [Thiohalobacter thiocyanaticus]